MITANRIACVAERYFARDYKAYFRTARGIAYNAEPCPDSPGSLSHSFYSIMTFFTPAECGGIGAHAIVRNAQGQVVCVSQLYFEVIAA